MADRGLYPGLVVAHLGRANRHGVGPQIEGAASFDTEAGGVAMTSQDAVFDATALEREAHVRATVVQGEDATTVIDDKDGTMAAVHNEPPLCLQLFKAAGE